jgi:tetratricopeptide (TPR) repeat protein
MLMLASEYDQSVHWGEQAIALAGELDAEDVRIHALNNVGSSLTGLGRTEDGLAMLRESCLRAIDAGLVHDAARAKMNVGDILFNVGRLSEASATYEELVAFVAPYHVVGFEAAARERLVLMHWLLGAWDVALRLEADLREAGLDSTGLTRIWHAATKGLIFNDLGQPESCLAWLQELHEAAMRNEELQTLIPFLTQLVRAHRLLGDPEAGRPAAESILQHMDAASYLDGSCGPAMLELVRWMAAQDGEPQVEAAQACLTRLEALAAQIHPVDAAAMLAEARGEIMAMSADAEGAASHFAEAAAAWADLGRPLPQARMLAQLGRVLARRGEQERAVAASAQAAELFEGLLDRLTDAGLRASFSGSELVGNLRGSDAQLG